MSKRPRLAIAYLATAATLAGCASNPRAPTVALAASDEVIVMENEPGPFCGRCDTVKVTALSDGRVWVEHGYWAGDYRNWRAERWLEQVSPQHFARFREHLLAYRPHGELALQDKPHCEIFWHDADGVRVEWRDATGTDKLVLSFGCDPIARRAMAEALRAAPELLGITTLKMSWGQWVATTAN